jgi:tetratricopeptide (TPR) repeat protein
MQGTATLGSLAATGFFAEWQIRKHEQAPKEVAERNHLIRRAMAAALARALREAENKADLAGHIPSAFRDDFFSQWPRLLEEAEKSEGNDRIDKLFPIDATEKEWKIVTSYFDSPSDSGFDEQSPETQQRLREREQASCGALSSLLRQLPVGYPKQEFITLFDGRLEKEWLESDALAFAAGVLPLYRIAFAAIASEGGPITDAIFLKQGKLTALQIDNLHALLVQHYASLAAKFDLGVKEIKEKIEEDGRKTRGELGDKIDDSTAAILQQVGELRKEQPHQVQDPTRKPFNLPFATLGKLFKGRDADMEALESQLQASGAAAIVQPASITGMGGIGKTRLAIEYALRHKGDFSALLFVSANTVDELNTNFALLSGPLVLNLPEYRSGNQPEQFAAVFRWLQSNHGWLLILDNVDTRESTAAVQQLVPQLSGGQVLITSRVSQWGAIHAIGLDLLSEEAAVSYLLEKTAAGRQPRPGDAAEAQALAEDLGRLALALEQAAAYINERAVSLAEYRRLWRVNNEKLIAYRDELATQYPKSVAGAFLISFEALSPNGRRLLNLLAWLAPEPLPRRLLEVAGGPFAAEHEQRLPQEKWPGALEEAEEALSELARFSLVSLSADKSAFSVHRLVQAVARRNQAGKEQDRCVAAALRWVDDALAGDPQDVRFWSTLEPLVPHGLAIAAEADRREIAEPTARLMNQLGLFFRSRAEWSQAEQMMRRALAIDEKSLRPDHPTVATRLNNLAELLKATNRLAEAEPMFRRALAIDEKSYGPDHPNVATGLNNLAAFLRATNRLAEAEPLYRRALAIDEKSYGPDHPDVATDLNNLAGLLRATNRLAEAEPMFRRVVSIFEKSLGPDHPNVATALNNLAELLQATNQLAEAEPLCRRALAIDEKSLGPNHPTVAIRLINLAGLLQATNRFAEAEPMFRRALAIDEKSYGPDHPEVATDLINLAGLLRATNRLAEAEPMVRRALEIFLRFTRATGHPHPHLQQAVNSYAGLLEQMGMSRKQILARLREMAPEFFK